MTTNTQETYDNGDHRSSTPVNSGGFLSASNQSPENVSILGKIWQVTGKSVIGASHIRSGRPNQDAIRWSPDSDIGEGPPLVLAVSDGHGSDKCPRSERGSRIAVTIATETITEFLRTYAGIEDLSAVKRSAEEHLGPSLVRQWLERVQADLKAEPLHDDDWAHLSEEKRAVAQAAVEKHPPLAYGATLLVVAISPLYMLFLQLGDGDILVLDDTGEVLRPFEHDARLMANETTSLCTPKAHNEIRVRFVPISSSEQLAMIMVSTDGYANSYSDEQGFYRVAVDYLQSIRDQGLKTIGLKLEEWLAEVSRGGSGDDISVGILKRLTGDDRDSDRRLISEQASLLRQSKTQVQELEALQQEQTAAHEIARQRYEARFQEQEVALEDTKRKLKEFNQLHSSTQETLTRQIAEFESRIRQLEQPDPKMLRRIRNLVAAVVALAVISVGFGVKALFPSATSDPKVTSPGVEGTPGPSQSGLQSSFKAADLTDTSVTGHFASMLQATGGHPIANHLWALMSTDHQNQLMKIDRQPPKTPTEIAAAKSTIAQAFDDLIRKDDGKALRLGLFLRLKNKLSPITCDLLTKATQTSEIEQKDRIALNRRLIMEVFPNYFQK